MRVTFALDCCDREAMSWAATTADHSANAVRDVMLAALGRRFGDAEQTPQQIEWLSDNGSGYIAAKTREFARRLVLKPLTTPVRSPQGVQTSPGFINPRVIPCPVIRGQIHIVMRGRKNIQKALTLCSYMDNSAGVLCRSLTLFMIFGRS